MEGEVGDEGVDGSASFWGAEGKLKKKPRSSNQTGPVSMGAWLLKGRTEFGGGARGSAYGPGGLGVHTCKGREPPVSLCPLLAPRGGAAGSAGQGPEAPCTR